MLTCFWVLVLSQLPSSMIMLDPTEVGQVDRAPLEVKEKEKAARAAVRRGELWLGTHGRLTQGSMLPRQAIEAQKIIKIKKKTRGRSRASRRAAKKQANVVTQQKVGAMGSKGSMGSMRRHRFMAHSAYTRGWWWLLLQAAMREKVRKQQREEKRLEAERKSGEGSAGVKSALSRFYERRRT